MADRFDKFTERARRVLTLAQEEAQRFNHHYIGTEHLLLGLVRQSDSTAARVLASSGVELNRVRLAVEHIIGSGDQAVAGPIRLTPRARRVIELAVGEARRLDHHYIGTEHLLLGMLREGEGIAAGVLLSVGLTLDRLRARTLVVLGEQADSGEEATERPFVEPALEDLVGVVPVAQTQRCAGVDVTILSVELYTDGFLVNLRLLSEPGAGPQPSPPPRFLRPAFEAEDDRGNRFTGRLYSPGSGGAGRLTRCLYRFTPQLDRSARELRLRCTELRWREPGRPGDEEVALGPCTFSIPLGDRPTGVDAPL